jgi:hypothetical protein
MNSKATAAPPRFFTERTVAMTSSDGGGLLTRPQRLTTECFAHLSRCPVRPPMRSTALDNIATRRPRVVRRTVVEGSTVPRALGAGRRPAVRSRDCPKRRNSFRTTTFRLLRGPGSRSRPDAIYVPSRLRATRMASPHGSQRAREPPRRRSHCCRQARTHRVRSNTDGTGHPGASAPSVSHRGCVLRRCLNFRPLR